MQRSAMKHRFKQRIGQTSEKPMMFSASKAKGIYIYDEHGNPFIDLVSGVSVCNLGHQHPDIVKAVKEQIDKHMHLMVYGEFIQPVQVELADLLVKQLHNSLNSVYYVNSGSEAIEGAMKLAKRYTGRHHIVACKHAYHGSSQGALSLLGDESFKQNFRPLLPGIDFIRFNNPEDFDTITTQTAAVVIEPIQAEAGIHIPDDDYLAALKQRCRDVGALLIFDEVQTGFGRTGKLFAHMHYNVVPDILCIAKAFGGGMPLGAFIADKSILDVFTKNPMLGHITTFGGHPVSCAAALANLKVLMRDKLVEQVDAKASLYFDLLKHQRIKKVWGKGLFIGIEMESAEKAARVMEIGATTGGFITDLFLFKPDAFRIGAPLIITESQIRESVRLILKTLDKLN